MAHFRETIRDQVVTALTGLGTTGSRVFSGRVSPLKEAEMPGLVVVPRSETAQFGGHSAAKSAERLLQIEVYGQARGNDDLHDLLDDISAEVEAAIFADGTLNGAAIQVMPPNTEISVDAAESARLGTIKMTFPVLYRTVLSTPSSQA